ncbi:hypothetical protein ACNKHN_14810 [Shigella flexneri]
MLALGEVLVNLILFNDRVRDEFEPLPSLATRGAGVCNGCQMMSNPRERIRVALVADVLCVTPPIASKARFSL